MAQPAFHALPSQPGNTGVAKALQHHLLQSPQANDKVSISVLHPPRRYGQMDTHKNTPTQVHTARRVCSRYLQISLLRKGMAT